MLRSLAPALLAGLLAAPAAAGSLAPAVVEAPVALPALRPAPVASAFEGLSVRLGVISGTNTREVLGTARGEILGGPVTVTADLPELGGQGIGATIGIGYDRRVGQRLVLGAFADYARPRVANDTALTFDILGLDAALDYTVTQVSSATLGGRVGFEATPGTLVYGLAGVTRSHWEGRVTSNLDVPPLADSSDNGGPTLGIGIETMLGERLSLRLEYRATRFADARVEDVEFVGGVPLDLDIDTRAQGVALSAAYRF